MTVPLLLVLGPLLAEISLLLCNFIIILIFQGWAGTAQCGRLAALLVEKMLLVELDQGPSFLFAKTVMVVATPLQAGQVGGSPLRHHSATPPQTPNPLTGLIVILVPCRNSSLEFILVSGFRCEIRTPSFAFLLCGFRNVPFKLISKCSNGVTSILP